MSEDLKLLEHSANTMLCRDVPAICMSPKRKGAADTDHHWSNNNNNTLAIPLSNSTGECHHVSISGIRSSRWLLYHSLANRSAAVDQKAAAYPVPRPPPPAHKYSTAVVSQAAPYNRHAADDVNVLDAVPDISRDLFAVNNLGHFSPEVAEFCSLQTLFVERCKQLGVKSPNSLVVSLLPSSPGLAAAHAVVDMNLGSTYLGYRGTFALASIVPLLSHLERLSLSGVGMSPCDRDVKGMLTALRHCPALCFLDVSNNRLNDDAGRYLLDLIIRKRGALQTVIIDRTMIRAPLKIRIEERTQTIPRLSRLTSVPSSYRALMQALPRLKLKAFLSGDLAAITLRRELSLLAENNDDCAADSKLGDRRLSDNVAAALVDLRQRLYRNRRCMQRVYDCFVLPDKLERRVKMSRVALPAAGRSVAAEKATALLHLELLGSELQEETLMRVQDGVCSWKAFFRGLRLLGIHGACHSLSQAITFAGTCGILSSETVLFGKLINMFRPHTVLVVAEESSAAAAVPIYRDHDCHAVLHDYNAMISDGGHDSRDHPLGAKIHASGDCVMVPSPPRLPSILWSAEGERVVPHTVADSVAPLMLPPPAAAAAAHHTTTSALHDDRASHRSRSSVTWNAGERKRLYEETCEPQPPTAAEVQFVMDRLYDARHALRRCLAAESKSAPTSGSLDKCESVRLSNFAVSASAVAAAAVSAIQGAAGGAIRASFEVETCASGGRSESRDGIRAASSSGPVFSTKYGGTATLPPGTASDGDAAAADPTSRASACRWPTVVGVAPPAATAMDISFSKNSMSVLRDQSHSSFHSPLVAAMAMPVNVLHTSAGGVDRYAKLGSTLTSCSCDDMVSTSQVSAGLTTVAAASGGGRVTAMSNPTAVPYTVLYQYCLALVGQPRMGALQAVLHKCGLPSTVEPHITVDYEADFLQRIRLRSKPSVFAPQEQRAQWTRMCVRDLQKVLKEL